MVMGHVDHIRYCENDQGPAALTDIVINFEINMNALFVSYFFLK